VTPPILVLAAGASSRMGKSKLFLDINGSPLLLHTTRTATRSRSSGVFIVLNPENVQHDALLHQLGVHVIQNEHWQKGIGSSIKKGIRAIIEGLPHTEAILLMVIDQPFITTTYLDSLIESHLKNPKAIIASHYADTFGVPAVIPAQYFKELEVLRDDEGAKRIISLHPGNRLLLECPEARLDLDTPEDYENFLQH
jgi:molybdenum cofactor cytidylyltransferase